MASVSGYIAPDNSDKQPDVVASRALEVQLRETLQRYELIFKATNDVLYELDLSKGTVTWNEALHTQYGYTEAEPAGTLEWWAQHIHPDDALRLEDEFSRWFEGKHDTWQGDYRFRKADNTYVYIRDRGVVYRGPDGAPLRIIGSFLDVTQQKQLDRAKDEFISLVSHQLRTPLTIIHLYSEMLTNGLLGPLTKEQEAHIGHITDASTNLIKLVGDILSISRLELGRIMIEPKANNANELLTACITELIPLADEKHAVIQFWPDESAMSVMLDKTVFEQIVHNLLTNAVRYTASRHGRVTVAFKRNRAGYLLSVKDNGIGIPTAAQTRIFNRFYRADNAVSLQTQGTGLGLYLTKLMVDSFGGSIWFKSTENKGTTFYVQFLPQGMRVI